MKKNRINTTSIREIKHSFKRFLSLLVMSLLGVLVFVGIKMSSPDMIMSLDKYYDDTNLYDIKIVSTLGLTNDDIKYLKSLKGVNDVYGSYSKDVLINIKEEDVVIKVIGINNSINKIKLLEGRMPKNDSEIVVEKAMLNKEDIKIGDTLSIIDDNELKNKNLTIVGTIKSPLYINSETGTANRGNTNIGTGKINYYTYVDNSAFNIDYYTEIYLTVKNAKDEITNNKMCNKLIGKQVDNLNKIKSERESYRYNEIYNSINEEIKKQEKEGLNKLNSAKNKLNDSKVKLDNAKVELDNNKIKLDNAKIELDNNKAKLDNAKIELDNNKAKLDNAKIELDNNKKLINDELSKFGLTLDDVNSITDITKEDIIELIPKDSLYYDEIINVINKIYDFDQDDIDSIINSIPTDIPNYDKVIDGINKILNNYDRIIEIKNSIDMINKADKEYNDGMNKYNEYLETYNNNYKKYLNYSNNYNKGNSEYKNARKLYNSNLYLYNTKIEEYYNSKKIFELKIKDAKSKLNEIPDAKWYIYDRLDDSGYSSFIDDGESVSNLAKIFPTIFFVVAILISLISMSRMVEDDRGNIGTLKSLGFSNKHIRKKYLIYSGVATFIGGIIGSLLGFFILPRIIFNIYKILFDVPIFKYDFTPTNIIIGVSIALLCICGTTLITIKKIVKEKPSELMRPKAPSNGKRVILERFPFLWKHINFSNKITIRNLFRYKKRVLMTIGGIMGCTSLMLTGFGIRDSITEIPDKQYNNIFKFDDMIYINNYNDKLFDNKHIVKKVNTYMNLSMQVNGYDTNIFVVENEKDMKGLINLNDLYTKKELNFKNNKVIISDKLASLTNKKVNDTITLTDTNYKEYEFIISGICENYVTNYVFMNKETYENNIDKYKTNIVYIKLDNLKYEEKVSKELLKSDDIMSVLSVNQTIKSVNNMLKSLNSVVAILILLSGALSFVILYNLSYINISERKREIATLKVLGFTDKEVDDYIIKETIILTILGILLGLIFGIFLTNIIINTVEIEMVRFIHHIKPYSFIITSSLILLFTVIVSILIHFALKKIDMIESLKSVE